MSNPPHRGRPRPILDSGTPRRTTVLRPPGSAHISLTARRAQRCRTATHPADHTPHPSTNAPHTHAPVDKHLSISAQDLIVGGGDLRRPVVALDVTHDEQAQGHARFAVEVRVPGGVV